MRLAYFVSPHGYGHAARTCAVVNALRRQAPGLELHLFTEVPEWFFRDSCDFDFSYSSCAADVGLAQDNALDESLERTARRLADFWPPAEATVDRLTDALEGRSIEVVVTDISPLGLHLARRSRLPAALVENFTWDWIYEHQGGETGALAPYREAFAEIYRGAPDLVIQAEPFCERRRDAVAVPPISRAPRLGRRRTRERLEIDAEASSVLLTMGGFSWSFGFLDSLRDRADVTFVVPGASDEAKIEGNLRLLPHRSSFFHPDLVRATDAVVGKVGYSTLAEAYAARTRFIFLDRPHFAESRVLTHWLEERLPTLRISRADFETGGWLANLDGLLAEPRPTASAPNGADAAATALRSLAG